MSQTVLDTRDMAFKKTGYKKSNPLGANILGEAIYWSIQIHLQLQVVLTAREEKHCVL